MPPTPFFPESVSEGFPFSFLCTTNRGPLPESRLMEYRAQVDGIRRLKRYKNRCFSNLGLSNVTKFDVSAT